jgi:uncharacterized protein with ParB-like and HNH nuclease domain
MAKPDNPKETAYSQDGHYLEESGLELVNSEVTDLDSSPPNYEIVTYPADFTLEGINTKYKKGQIGIPGFQRKFVWSIAQASKLIESFLLGLPVPAVFLYTDPEDNTLQVIDGQQRLMSIVYFFEGFFGPVEKKMRAVFSLQGLHEKSPYRDKTYELLGQTDELAFNRLNDSVLRAFVIKQLNPNDLTSIYHVFERLNTGGTQLVSQEIRNCVYHGTFNDMLIELNSYPAWRTIFGKKTEDKRQRDVELILRFLTLFDSSNSYEKPMKDFLSRFMSKHKKDTKEQLTTFQELFHKTAEAVLKELGERPFHIRAGINAAVFDSIFTAFAMNLDKIPKDVKTRYDNLVTDPDYLKLVSSGTTDKDAVQTRLTKALAALFG